MPQTKNKKQTKKSYLVLLISLLCIVIIIVLRFVLIKNPSLIDNDEAVFKAPQQQDLDQNKIRVSENRNLTSSTSQRFPNFIDLRKLWPDGDIFWIATGNGLVKYNRNDNEIVKIYTEADGLPDNTITDLVKYKDKFFLGTQGGLSIFDPREESFTNYLNLENWKWNANPDEFILANDNLWMSTFGGLRRYDLLENEWYDFTYPDLRMVAFGDSLFFIQPTLSDNNKVWQLPLQAKSEREISVSWEDSQCTFDDIVANQNYAFVLCNLNPGPGSKIYFLDRESSGWQEMPELTPASGHSYAFSSMILTPDSLLIKELYSGGDASLVRYHLDTKQKEQINLPAEVINQIATPVLFNEASLWFGTNDNLYTYNLESRSLFNFIETQKFPTVVKQILAQKDDLLLANTNLGIGFLDWQKKKWEAIEAEKKDRAFALWQGDEIWFSSFNEGMGVDHLDLVHHNLKDKTKEVYPLGDGSRLASRILAQEGEALVFGSDGGVLFYYPQEKQEEVFKPPKVSLFFSRPKVSDAKIWFGFSELDSGGLVSFDLKERQYVVVDLPKTANLAPQGGVIAGTGEIYFAPVDYKEEGLFVYNLVSKEVKKLNRDNSALKQNGAQLFDYVDPLLVLKVRGKVPLQAIGRSVDSFWGQYYEVGLEIYNRASQEWRFFNTENGLLDNEFDDAFIGKEYIYILGGGMTVLKKP